MKEVESDFLTHKQRVKFVGAIVPLINFFIIPVILFSATNKLIVACLCILPPIVGITFLKLSTRSAQELLFKIIPIIINGSISFLVCWLAGPASPTFLIGIALIGACTLILEKLAHLIIAIIYALTAITIGCYLGGKTVLDISSYLVLLICYSFILVRMLYFTIIQGREIMKSHQKIEAQNRLIEEKQKDILDSIRYAKRIQTSLLPTEKYIDKVLNEHAQKAKQKDKSQG